MDRIADLVGQLEPELPPPSLDVQARQRDALLRSMASAEQARPRPSRWRIRHKGWFVALTGAAAAAIVAGIVVSGSSPSPRPPGSTTAVLTALTRALAATGDDIEEVQSAVPDTPLSTTSWLDLSTGACRTDTSLNGAPSLTIFVQHGSAVIIDYGTREWWNRATEGVTCEPLNPQTIKDDVTAGHFTVAGHATLDGQPSLKLVFTSTSTGLHQVTKLTTLWVNAATYLPIQSASTDHLAEQTKFTWLPATAITTAIFDVTVPAGFQRIATPAPEPQTGG